MSDRQFGTDDFDTAQSALPTDVVMAFTADKTQQLLVSKLPLSDPTAVAIAAGVASGIQSYDSTVTQRLASKANDGPFVLDNQTFASLASAIAYVLQIAHQGGGGTGSQPVPSGGPTISDSTVNFDQIVTVTAGTTSAGTVTNRQYRWIVNGVAQPMLWSISALSNYAAQPVGGTPPAANAPLILEELLYWAGGAPISNPSIQYTLNAGAAVPFKISDPTVNGTASPGSALSISGGNWSNSPDANGYTFYAYDGGQPSQGGILLGAPYTSQMSPMSFPLTTGVYDGKTLVFGVTASNGAGTSAPAYSVPVQVSGGLKPVNIAPVGFRYSAQYAVGDIAYLDYGLLPDTSQSDYWSNNPSATGFNVQMYRGGTPISGGGQNVTQYKFVALDQDKIISFSVTASNGAGVSVQPAYAAGVMVVASTGVGTIRPGHNYLTSISSAMWDIVNARLATYPPYSRSGYNGYATPDPQALIAALPTSAGGGDTTLSAGATVAQINTALTTYTNVFLNAGTYTGLLTHITVPVGKTLIGIGEVFLDFTANYVGNGSSGNGNGVRVMSTLASRGRLVNVTIAYAGGIAVWVDEAAIGAVLYQVTVYRAGHNTNQPDANRSGQGFYISANADFANHKGHSHVVVSCEAIQCYDTKPTDTGGWSDGFRWGISFGGNDVGIDCTAIESSDDGHDNWDADARNWLFWCKAIRCGKNSLTASQGDGNGFKCGGNTALTDNTPHYYYAPSTDNNKNYAINYNSNLATIVVENPSFSGDDVGYYAFTSGTASNSHYTVINS